MSLLRAGIVGWVMIGLGGAAWGQTRPADFGMQWVRSNPFRMAALVEHVDYIRQPGQDASVEQYRNAGLNFMSAWSFTYLGIGTAARDGNMPWSVQSAPGRPLSEFISFNNRHKLSGIQIGDEPGFVQMAQYGAKIAEMKANFPDAIVYSNALPSYATRQALYDQTGNTPAPSDYNWSRYLDDFISIIKPDVLMWDHYPFPRAIFGAPARRTTTWFSDMMTIRAKAQAAGLPYWGFIQSGFNVNWGRTPSESDMRMNMFSMLTVGFSGMEHFVYRSSGFDGLIRADRTPTVLYDYSRTASVEVTNLGNITKNLLSTDVRFVAGNLGINPIPQGLTAWTVGAGGDQLIKAISVNDLGTAKDALVGYFLAEDGTRFLMLTNLYHHYNLSAEAARVSFRIEFDPSITQILHYNASTGEPELLDLSNNVLNLTLPGGTGTLLQYTQIPEPGLGLSVLVGALMLRRRIGPTSSI